MDDVEEIPGAASPTLRRVTRLVLAAQALCMLGFLATLLPEFLDHLFRPLICPANEWCMDFRGLTFLVYAIVLVPLAALLLGAAWLLRKRRRWPAILPIAVDVFILLAAVSLVFFPSHWPGPSVVGQVLLLLVPAIGSLTVVITMLRRSLSSGPG